MTCEPHKDRFINAFPLATLVLVDMRKDCLSSVMSLRRSDIAGILSNCRAALAHARRIGWPVAFVRRGRNCAADQSGEWIKGFEPQRSEALFDQRNGSCYSSPYFAQGVKEAGGSVVLAGFLGSGGCLSTCADAFLAGQRMVFLSDATLDDVSRRMFDEPSARLLRTFTSFDIATLTTSAWIKATVQFPVTDDRQHFA